MDKVTKNENYMNIYKKRPVDPDMILCTGS